MQDDLNLPDDERDPELEALANDIGDGAATGDDIGSDDVGDAAAEVETDRAPNEESSAALAAEAAQAMRPIEHSLEAPDAPTSEAAAPASAANLLASAMPPREFIPGTDRELLPAHLPPRRKNGMVYLEPRKLPPPTPFEELVFSYAKPPAPERLPGPEVQERWLPPEVVSRGSERQAPAPAGTAEPGDVQVTVQVVLTPEARERIAELAIAKAAETHQSHVEIVAKRLYQLTQEIKEREAARRVLHRW